MTKLTVPSPAMALLTALVLVTACNPAPAPKAAEPVAETPVPADTAPTNAVAIADTATAAPAAAAPAAPAAPGAGMVSLAIKDAAGNAVSGDPTKGAATFRQCQTCHALEAGVNKVGPSLHGLFGRVSGKVPGFTYSEAMKTAAITWDEQSVYDYVEAPRAHVPGTTMAFVGVKDPQKRADLIAYLKANTN